MIGDAQRSKMAFLDESQSDQKVDPHTYLLAAAVCDDADLVFTRSLLAGLRLKGQRKLHWRDESHKRRLLIVQTIATVSLQHLVVVRDGRSGERIERRRRHCLERMLHELDQLRVATATFESRGPADDRRDRAMLDALRAQQAISPELRIDHAAGPTEALLWLPDAICGAVVRQRLGDPSFVQIINARVPIEVISISVD